VTARIGAAGVRTAFAATVALAALAAGSAIARALRG
jgi:hypothetical protein